MRRLTAAAICAALADALCNKLQAAGGACIVSKN